MDRRGNEERRKKEWKTDFMIAVRCCSFESRCTAAYTHIVTLVCSNRFSNTHTTIDFLDKNRIDNATTTHTHREILCARAVAYSSLLDLLFFI